MLKSKFFIKCTALALFTFLGTAATIFTPEPASTKNSVLEDALALESVLNPFELNVAGNTESLLAIDEAQKPKAETLSYIVQAGDVLIFNLPELLGGRKIEDYQIKEAPALSWLVKRSFFWRTLAKDVGKHEILLNARINGSAVENVVVEVEIR